MGMIHYVRPDGAMEPACGTCEVEHVEGQCVERGPAVPDFAAIKTPQRRKDAVVKTRHNDRLYERLVRLTHEPDNGQDCWRWKGTTLRGRNREYPELNIRARGKHRRIRAHRAMLVLLEIGDEIEHFWDLYELYGVAQFECDHICIGEPACINPDHLQWLWHEDHREQTKARGQSIYRRYT